MIDSPKMPGETGKQPDAGAVPSSGRRRLLQAGISAAPVVMTVVSRPVLAVQCDSPSGFTSLSPSHPGPGMCGGHTPSMWLGDTANWPPNYTPATLFVDKFPTGPMWFGLVSGKTLAEVLDPPPVSSSLTATETRPRR